jgi:hypothetical protein
MPLFGRRPKANASFTLPGVGKVEGPTNAIVAAATRMLPDEKGAPWRVNNSAWAQEAWRQYDVCGELHFAVTWLANSASRVKLTVVRKDGLGVLDASNTNDARVIELLRGLLANVSAQVELIRMSVINLTVPGDGWLLAETEPGSDEFTRWVFLSTQEVTIATANDRALINVGDGKPRFVVLDEVLLLRVHRPHPRMWWEADSPTRAALPVLRELEELSKYLFANINSRLAGPGILGIPSELTFPAPSGTVDPGQSNVMAFLTEAMLAPIEDMGHPGAVVPIVVEGPADLLKGIVWITNPNVNLTTVIAELRTKAIARLALTLDLSPETLLGSANSNHWGQWAIEEQSFKFHIAPVLALLTTALTEGYMRPVLEAAGIDPAEFQIWYDATDLVQRTDQGAAAMDLYDRGELSGEALLRETGFPASDMPTGKEADIRAILKAITIAPQAAGALLPELMKLYGIEVDLSVLIPPDPAGGTPPQENIPEKNPESRALPEAPKANQNPPKKNGTPGETSN